MIPPPARPILVAEDDPDEVFLLRRACAKAGIDVRLVFVASGDEAIDYLSGLGRYADRDRHPLPAVVLLDLKMPRRDGFEVLQWVRGHADFGRLPVVVLSSSRQSSDIARAYELGANSFLVKPGSFDDLLTMVRGFASYWLVHNEPPALGR